MTKDLSTNSFQCWFCEKPLVDQRYVIEENFAVCLTCFEEKYARSCSQCQQLIRLDTQGMIFREKPWHKTCFNCSTCQKSLIHRKFAYRNEKLYCRDCLIEQFAERCYRCNRSIEPGEKCVRYQSQMYHQSCFVCHACQQPLIDGNFRQHDQYILCFSCHLHLLGIYCIKCHQAIITNGIIYHNHPFHQDCFLCTNCSRPLTNERYVEYEHEAYCSSCARK